MTKIGIDQNSSDVYRPPTVGKTPEQIVADIASVGDTMASAELKNRLSALDESAVDDFRGRLWSAVSEFCAEQRVETSDIEAILRVAADECILLGAFTIRAMKHCVNDEISPAPPQREPQVKPRPDENLTANARFDRWLQSPEMQQAKVAFRANDAFWAQRREEGLRKRIGLAWLKEQAEKSNAR